MVIKRWMLVVLALYVCCGAAVAQKHDVKKETLLETTKSWDGSAYRQYPAGQPQLSVLRITIPAHTTMQWHQHPVPNAAYIVSGELTVEKKDGAKLHLKAGQVLPELVNEVHRGVAGDSDVVLIVFYAGAVGVPLSR